MEENHNVLDTHLTETRALKCLSAKYATAMVLLVLNNKLAPYLFASLYSLFYDLQEISLNALMALNAVAAYLIPVFALFKLFKNDIKTFVPDREYKPFKGEALLLFLAGMTAGTGGALLTELINSVIDRFFGTGEIPDAFEGMSPTNMTEFAVFTFFICVVAPITEEYIFRSVLLKPLRAYGDLTAVLASGVIFGLYHGNFDQFAYATLLGISFSVIAVKYNSIVPTTLLHAANNFIVTCASDLGTASEKAPGQIKVICGGIASVCEYLSSFLIFAGIAAFVICLVNRSFVLRNTNSSLSASQALRIFAGSPAVIVGIVVMFLLFFD